MAGKRDTIGDNGKKPRSRRHVRVTRAVVVPLGSASPNSNNPTAHLSNQERRDRLVSLMAAALAQLPAARVELGGSILDPDSETGEGYTGERDVECE